MSRKNISKLNPTLFCLGLYLLASTNVAFAEKRCEITDNHGYSRLYNGQLSPFWGYELTGVDLAKDILIKNQDALNTITYGTWESVNLSDLPENQMSSQLISRRGNQHVSNPEFSSHGTQVNVIINGKFPFGIAQQAQLAVCSEDSSTDSYSNNTDEYIAKALENGNRLFVTSTTASDGNFFDKLVSNNIISVRSAGNYYPETEHYQANPVASIMVGQISPLGLPSSSSSAYPEVTVSAPGTNLSQFNGKTTIFGGTSGAQPLVSGCILNTLSLLPELTQEQIKKIIIKTSLPTVNHFETPQLNGVGTINCYKMIRVSERLLKVAPKDRGELIDHDEIYNFNQDSIDKYHEAEAIRSTDCNSEKSRLKFLRTAFLLDQNNDSARKELIKSYYQTGLNINAFALESFSGLDDQKINKIQPKVKNTNLEGDLIRFLTKRAEAGKIMQEALNSSDTNTVLIAANAKRHDLSRNEVESALIRLFKLGRIDGMNYSTFERLFRQEYRFSKMKLINICKEGLKSDQNMLTLCKLVNNW